MKTLQFEKTHFVKLPLEDGAGTISLLFTITGTYGTDSITDLDYNKETLLSSRYKDEIITKYVKNDTNKKLAYNLFYLNIILF